MLRLEEVVHIADGINHVYSNWDEVTWAFQNMRLRNWLVESNGRFGLTPKARREIDEVVGEGTVLTRLDRLKGWAFEPPAK